MSARGYSKHFTHNNKILYKSITRFKIKDKNLKDKTETWLVGL